jgi:hypothetical protein
VYRERVVRDVVPMVIGKKSDEEEKKMQPKGLLKKGILV